MNVKKNFYSKFYSTFLTLLLLISLVTMPMSTIVYAENESDETVDDVTLGEQEETEENEPIDELEGTEGNETNHEETEEVDPEVEQSETSDEGDVDEDEANEVTDDEQSKEEIVKFENDLVHETVKRELGIESDNVTVSDMEKLREFYINLSENDTKLSLKGLE